VELRPSWRTDSEAVNRFLHGPAPTKGEPHDLDAHEVLAEARELLAATRHGAYPIYVVRDYSYMAFLIVPFGSNAHCSPQLHARWEMPYGWVFMEVM
jgi:hypothetical protein